MAENGIGINTTYFTPTGLNRDDVRERNEMRKSGRCYDCLHAHDRLSTDDSGDAKADIDMLLAEVEALSAIVEEVGRAAAAEIERQTIGRPPRPSLPSEKGTV